MRRISSIGNHLRDDATRTVTISTGSFQNRLYAASVAGSHGIHQKQNQDFFGFRANSVVVCDGHGQFGESVARLVAERILLAEGKSEEKVAREVEQALASSLGKYAAVSGAASVWMRATEESITLCNVGDSRAILVGEDGKLLFETRDHKPEDEIERKRIVATGSKVEQRPGDVHRVGGLAMARSFGDFAFRRFGIISTPDVTVLPRENVSFVLLGSDGVWDMFSSEEAADFVFRHEDPETCCIDLVKSCLGRWVEDTDGRYCDDITAAVMYLGNTHQTESSGN